jgi:hypothetical protein
MFNTYKATLIGEKIEWQGEIPQLLDSEQPVDVFVTILKENVAQKKSQGEKMAEALEKLAAIQALSDISNPEEWQREQRQDRELPGREA